MLPVLSDASLSPFLLLLLPPYTLPISNSNQPVTMADPNSPVVNVKLENAIRAVSEKKPIPEIDFTLHTMEDGTQVSTLERVCKGMSY